MPRIKKQPVEKIVLESPAKLNLALQVTGQQENGFHTLNTVFERISLADSISFVVTGANAICLECSHPAVPLDERNLVFKVALLLRKVSGINKGVRIHIQKNIPVAAGLAGGSSNAATALIGLNKLWNLRLSRAALIGLAREIGSDVAFFLNDTSFALGTGRGDQIKKLPIKHRYWHVLVTAKEPLLTKDVYGVYSRQFLDGNKACLTKKTADVTMLIRCLGLGDVSRVQELVFNDLTGPIGVLRPPLLKLKARVQQFAGNGVCFSGSGPSIFALTESQSKAESIADVFRKSYDQVFVVSTA